MPLSQKEQLLFKEADLAYKKHIENPTFDNCRALEIAQDDLLNCQKARIWEEIKDTVYA